MVFKSFLSFLRGCNYFYDVEEGRLSIELSVLVFGLWYIEGLGMKDCN